MAALNLHDSEFLLSAVKYGQYAEHNFPEIAFVGRSNVGKSSLINVLLNRRNFARVSGQPGRTQTINFYRIDTIGFVDLPGYGFAKVPESVRQQWKPMIEDYLTKRKNLVGIIQIVDIRHKPSAEDEIMSRWLLEMGIPAWVVATKADKISRGQYKPSLERIMNLLHLPGVIFSSHTKEGRDNVLGLIKEMIEIGRP